MYSVESCRLRADLHSAESLIDIFWKSTKLTNTGWSQDSADVFAQKLGRVIMALCKLCEGSNYSIILAAALEFTYQVISNSLKLAFSPLSSILAVVYPLSPFLVLNVLASKTIIWEQPAILCSCRLADICAVCLKGHYSRKTIRPGWIRTDSWMQKNCQGNLTKRQKYCQDTVTDNY